MSSVASLIFHLFEQIPSLGVSPSSNLNGGVLLLLLLAALLSAALGFGSGILFAFVYNWVAQRFGGIPVVLSRGIEAGAGNS